MPGKCTSIIHVNRHMIAKNAKDDGNRPVFTIKQGRKLTYCRDFIAHGTVRGIGTSGQLSCGARAWLETDGEIEMIDAMSYREAVAIG
ncbi:hypothetical protein [Pseudosulfitobacter pseudonitzschiae]|uniref:hypothetical protein n=1 Tax=Pseudosulfitobacter pseudonitzschiae TaxID=1402135 RepID=UPI003B813FB0